jgi:hypothetical protein
MGEHKELGAIKDRSQFTLTQTRRKCNLAVKDFKKKGLGFPIEFRKNGIFMRLFTCCVWKAMKLAPILWPFDTSIYRQLPSLPRIHVKWSNSIQIMILLKIL